LPVEHLISILGISTTTSMVFLTEIVDINRFKSLDHLSSYFGLIPGEDSSGDPVETRNFIQESYDVAIPT
jgi:transposase